jgi:hypothetical protein
MMRTSSMISIASFVLLVFFSHGKGFAVERGVMKISASIYNQIGIAISEAERKGVSVEGRDIHVEINGVQTFVSFSNSLRPVPRGYKGSPEGYLIFGVELLNGEVVKSSFMR